MEVITYNNGYYGRFLILIKFGLGCTVWYGFTPGIEYLIPVDSLVFQEISNFDPFLFIPEYHIQPGFDKMTLLEKEENNILSVLQAAFKSEKPFMDIHLPTDDGKWDENLPDGNNFVPKGHDASQNINTSEGTHC